MLIEKPARNRFYRVAVRPNEVQPFQDDQDRLDSVLLYGRLPYCPLESMLLRYLDFGTSAHALSLLLARWIQPILVAPSGRIALPQRLLLFLLLMLLVLRFLPYPRIVLVLLPSSEACAENFHGAPTLGDKGQAAQAADDAEHIVIRRIYLH